MAIFIFVVRDLYSCTSLLLGYVIRYLFIIISFLQIYNFLSCGSTYQLCRFAKQRNPARRRKKKLNLDISKYIQGIILPNRRINLKTPYKKLFNQGLFTPKMHVFHTKRCASFSIKDVHLFILYILEIRFYFQKWTLE